MPSAAEVEGVKTAAQKLIERMTELRDKAYEKGSEYWAEVLEEAMDGLQEVIKYDRESDRVSA